MSRKNQLTTADCLTYSDYQKLLKGLHRDKNYFWEMYALLGFCTACRASDVLNLVWLDVLNKRETVIVEQKTGKPRKISFNKDIQAKIRSMYELMGSPSRGEYIFKSSTTNKPVTIQYVNRVLKDLRYKYAISIDHFSTHTFRKTFGRYVYEVNNKSAESLILLNKILNHSSIQMTKIYIGITQEEIKSVYDSIVL